CVSIFLVAPDGTTVCSHSGLHTFTNIDLSPYAGSVVQFQFLVSDAVENSFDSALLVDGVQGTGLTDVTVPEPQSWTLMVTSGIMAYLALRRRRRHHRTSAVSELAMQPATPCRPGAGT